MKSILVVCEGNICRSPMGQALLAQALPVAHVQSAGLGALVGYPADSTAMQLMAARGLDISAHRAQQITRALCLQSDLVLVMDTDQRQRVEALYPQVRGRVFRLAEPLKQDIPDPFRQSELAFREALALIDAGTTGWLRRIVRL
ncbi:low molecular weight protein-tyrosine-phosphatase [Ramlibacter sp. AN1015]|uniref:low molecular weight protein-tyrosine-phosphatase n=1 Tax=Ramlibacter sp. AN1015 TaxID=3133428 RepID=UPI0030BEA755